MEKGQKSDIWFYLETFHHQCEEDLYNQGLPLNNTSINPDIKYKYEGDTSFKYLYRQLQYLFIH